MRSISKMSTARNVKTKKQVMQCYISNVYIREKDTKECNVYIRETGHVQCYAHITISRSMRHHLFLSLIPRPSCCCSDQVGSGVGPYIRWSIFRIEGRGWSQSARVVGHEFKLTLHCCSWWFHCLRVMLRGKNRPHGCCAGTLCSIRPCQ